MSVDLKTKIEKFVYKDFIERKLSKFLWLILLLFVGVEVCLYQFYKNSLLGFVSAVLGIAFFYLLALKLADKMKSGNKVISFLSMNLLTLYIIHEPIMALILKYFSWGIASSPLIVSSGMFLGSIFVAVVFILIRDFIRCKFLKA